jgi:hypothetical protein
MTDPQVRALARELVDLRSVIRSMNGPQLAHSSIEGGAITEYDYTDTLVAQYGRQYDGTSTAATLVSPPPAAPSAPTIVPVAGGLVVTWDGTFEGDVTVVAPMDWRQVDFVAGPVGMDPIATPPMVAATSPRGAEHFLPLPPGAYDIALVSRTLAGRPSEPSPVVTATALPLVDDTAFQQALEDLTAAEGRLDIAEVDIDDNLTEIEAAKARLTIAEAQAATALADAATAQAKANAAITVYRQSSAPSGSLETNDLWIDSDDGLLYVWTGSWTLSADQRIATVVTSNATKTTVFAQTSQPSTSNRTVGDIWLDTDDGNKIYDWSGSWTARLLGATAISATARQLGSTTVYRQSTAPASGMIANDLWIDSDDGKVYVYTGTWTLSDDQRIATVVSSNATKATMFFQNSAPSGVGRVEGDLWVDMDDMQKVYRWSTVLNWVLTDIANVGYIASRATDLVTNGTALTKTNLNFASYFDYDGADAPDGTSGAFISKSTVAGSYPADEFIPYDPTKKLRYGFQIRKSVAGAGNNAYGYLQPIDVDGNTIDPTLYMFITGTTTTLAQALNPGDTTMVLTSAANWYGSAAKPAGAATYFRSALFWDYVDSTGRAWPTGSYSRNRMTTDSYADGSVNAATGVVTLRAPYAGMAHPAGTPVSQPSAGGSYIYMPSLTNGVVSSTWTTYSDIHPGGIFPPASQAVPGTGAATWTTGMPPGTAKIRVGWLLNYPSGGGKMSVAAVTLSDAQAAQNTADAASSLAALAKSTADGKVTAFRQSSAPTTTGRVLGDLWIDSDDGLLYVWTGAWTVSPDQRIATVITSNAAKTTVFVQTSQPSTSGRTTGDLWLDSDDGNKPYDWNGSAWTARQFGDSALASLDLNKLTVVGTATLNTLVATEIAAKTAAIQTADIGNLFVTGTSTLNEVVAQQIGAEVAEFVTVRANNLESTLALVSTITSGGTGRRWEADNKGIRVYEADGTILINFPTDPNTPSSFYGDLVASSLTVEDQLAIRGMVNEISKGAQLVLAGGTTAPTSAPTITIDWENYVASVDGGAYGFDPYRFGWSKYGANFYTVQGLYGQVPTINRYSATTGNRDFWGFDLNATGSIWTNLSSVMIGNVIYVLGCNAANNQYSVQGWNVDTQVKVAEWVYPHVFGTSGTAHRKPQLAYDGTNLVIAFTNYADNKIQWRKYAPTTGVQQGATVIGTAIFAREMFAFWIGTADFGATKAIVVAQDVPIAYVLDAAGAPDPNNYFTLPTSKIYGLTYDTGLFYSFDAIGAKFYKHTGIRWTTESSTWYLSNSWWDGDAAGTGTHETAQSPRKAFTMVKRARLNLTTAVLPVRPVPTTTDDAKATRIYLGRGSSDPGRTYMERQSTLADGARNATLTTVTLPAGAALAASPPPATSNFPPSSPGRIVSADGATIILNGDGSYTLGRIARDAAGATVITDTTWTALSLAAPTVAFGSGLRAPSYRKKLNGEVQIRGLIKSTVAGAAITSTPLPVGCRPTEPETFICQAGGSSSCRIDIATTGHITLTSFNTGGTSSFISLSGIYFDAVS